MNITELHISSISFKMILTIVAVLISSCTKKNNDILQYNRCSFYLGSSRDSQRNSFKLPVLKEYLTDFGENVVVYAEPIIDNDDIAEMWTSRDWEGYFIRLKTSSIWKIVEFENYNEKYIYLCINGYVVNRYIIDKPLHDKGLFKIHRRKQYTYGGDEVTDHLGNMMKATRTK